MTDFHIHTSYCDGKDTPEAIAEIALARGFRAIGFSGHGYTAFDDGYCMNPQSTRAYCRSVRALQEQYRGRLDIFCGVEQDLFGDEPQGEFDYKIASVHYLPAKGIYHSIDSSPEGFAQLLAEVYHGDFEALAEEYFALVGTVLDKVPGDFIGHFDLITKFSERMELTAGERYYAAARSAIQRLIPYGKPFEINVGAMTRGWRTSPYPSGELLREIHRQGGSIILSGDCHDASRLGDFLPEIAALARGCGFTHAMEITANGLVPRALS